MYSKSVNYVGAPIDAFNATVLPDPNVPVVGFRIIPVLAVGATLLDMYNAYLGGGLQVRITKQSKNFKLGTTEDMFVVGPDWNAVAGVGRIQILSGLNPCTYLVELATDCKEMKFVDTPVMPGFSSMGASPGGTSTASSETQNLTAAAPTLSSDGVDITGAKAIRLSYKAATAGATLNAAGSALAYAYSSTLSRWIRMPELDVNFAALGAAVVEPMAVGPAPYPIVFNPSITRLQHVANAMTVGAGTQVIRSLEVMR